MKYYVCTSKWVRENDFGVKRYYKYISYKNEMTHNIGDAKPFESVSSAQQYFIENANILFNKNKDSGKMAIHILPEWMDKLNRKLNLKNHILYSQRLLFEYNKSKDGSYTFNVTLDKVNILGYI